MMIFHPGPTREGFRHRQADKADVIAAIVTIGPIWTR
jgi:hypothetical protein